MWRALARSVAPRATRGVRQAHNLSLDVTDSGVAMIRIDCVGEKQNTLSQQLMTDFEEVVGEIEGNPKVKAAVLISAKPGSWVAGADVKMIARLGSESAETVTAMAGTGQQSMDKLEAMQKRIPWVAAIDGPCLGGGLELALSCGYRIASTSSKTVLGVPEVMLGLLPGAGGTQRLPKLVGAPTALDMMLTGKNIKPARAKKMGLVDLVVDPSALERNAVATALQLASGEIKPKKRKQGWMDWFLESTPPGRYLLFSQASKKAMKATKGKYPAPPAILSCAKAGMEGGHMAGSTVERTEFGKLAVTPESAALRGLFFGTTAAKKNPFGAVERPVETIAVLGAGLMGAGIAEVSAAKDIRVLLKDRDLKGLSRGEKQIAGNVGGKLKKKRLSQYAHDTTISRVTGLTDDHASWKRHFSGADMVIEAVFEEMGVKHKVVREMEAVLPPHAIIASNTSTLPIGDIAKAAQRPENIVGMHYFSPVDKMPLLEVIPHATTSKEACAAAFDVGLRQGKTVIAVKDVPGFYVNRCLGPFLVEAMALLQRGADPIKINESLTDFGFMVGGITLADEVGIDVAHHVVNNLIGEPSEGYLGVRMDGADLKALEAFVDAGFLGRKSGKGFFDYSNPKEKKINPDAIKLMSGFVTDDSAKGLSKPELSERMVLRFMKEAIHCLEDGVISNPRDGDIGAVFGIAFPPFLGGPFSYLDTLGAQSVVDKLEALQKAHGDQFAPPALLVEHAKAGTTFHAAEE